jgi:hypothetical protein
MFNLQLGALTGAEPEVCDQELPISPKEDVDLLCIEVHHPLGVHMLDAQRHLVAQAQVGAECRKRKPIVAEAGCEGNLG